MRLKRYHAPGMAQAMAQVRAELGEDALILSTQRLGNGVEVTAALEPDELPPIPLVSADPTLAAALDFHGVPALHRGDLQRGDLATNLAAAFGFAALPLDERPLLIAGPPGAGKTLTVARLAT